MLHSWIETIKRNLNKLFEKGVEMTRVEVKQREVSLAVTHIPVTFLTRCDECGGSGEIKTAEVEHTCTVCSGTGSVEVK